MNKEYLELKKIKPNEANPRDITEDKFKKLVNSLLSFPAMLELRPIVIDNANVILGGNQRYKALQSIAQMSFDELTERIASIKDFKKKKKDEKAKILSYWQDFLESPKAPTLEADTLTDEEKQRFIIEDNTDFGNWNWDCLANEWDNEDLQNWGLDVWNAEEQKEKEEKEYTNKLEAPIYEITGETPLITELFNNQRTKELIKEIDKSKASKEEKEFLKLASYRHVVFDFQKIAEYYAKANKEVKDLMEKNALVIIDYKKAIENGYVEVGNAINEISKNFYNEK